ncbi:MAG TPA: GDSL-type esterase/lipase family protein [Myxococcota bacterium]|nr:GDSL-type esterase/lipase family protein [Myxococcota bacterium]
MATATRIHWLVPLVQGPPVVAAVALAALRPADASWTFAGALVLLLAAGFAFAWRFGRTRPEWVVAACAFSLVLWPEVGLRALGLRFDEVGAIFGIWEPIAARDHPDFFWTLPPERPEVNAQGFPGPDFTIPKPDGVWRMLFFGDSCTQQGFPQHVAERLASDLPQQRFEAVNLGVAGYSSLQGRLVADAWLARLEPDLSVVFFGWNDRWRAFGMSDAERARRRNQPWLRAMLSSRLLQMLVRLPMRELPSPLETPRVSAVEYRENLAAIGALATRDGRVLLLTAPSSHARRGFPAELVKAQLATSGEAAVASWRAYNDVVRALARERGWPLLDLAARADAAPDPDAIFLADGIHFTPRGLAWISDEIARAIEEMLAPARSGA